ncbi:MAG: hypothetical protein ACRC1G_05455 [Bradyrhizobium sp.]|nr:hypothetical protein [Bradyrhizobium sp.]
MCFTTPELRDIPGLGQEPERILSKTSGGGRRHKERAPAGSDIGRGDPQEAAAFIAETTGELSKIAERHGLGTLRHLLDMTQLEAAEWLRNRRRLS